MYVPNGMSAGSTGPSNAFTYAMGGGSVTYCIYQFPWLYNKREIQRMLDLDIIVKIDESAC